MRPSDFACTHDTARKPLHSHLSVTAFRRAPLEKGGFVASLYFAAEQIRRADAIRPYTRVLLFYRHALYPTTTFSFRTLSHENASSSSRALAGVCSGQKPASDAR